MHHPFLKRTFNAGLAVLICLLILCGIYAIYVYKVNTSSIEQARPAQVQGLTLVAHQLPIPAVPALTPAPTPQSAQVAQTRQQSVQQNSGSQISPINMKNWQSYFRKLHVS